uniref:Neur_chan_LBD domain-containing protein n=1 Tax=Rhabditophanes sp. KR3021 TaxID=114890 RepID=A0AC35TZR6_9BILA
MKCWWERLCGNCTLGRLQLFTVLFLKLVQLSNQGRNSQLLDTILDNYDHRVRPLADSGDAVIINMTIVLGILTELNENQQVAAFVISHVQKWHDPALQWEPNDFDGQTQLIVPQKHLWIPKLFVYNSKDTKLMLNDNLFDARIQSTGDVKINIPQFVSCICRLSIELFPFDFQWCPVAIASPVLTVTEMDAFVTDPPQNSYFTGNAEWEYQRVIVKKIVFTEEDEQRVEIQYIFQLKRRPMFYLTVIVAPNFLISFLSILGIFSPGTNDGERNEKVSLGLGSLLAMTVLLGIVAGAMPKSNSIPLLGYYILAVILICATAVAVSMTFLAINKKLIQHHKMPTDFAYRVMWVRPRTRESRRHYSKMSSMVMFQPNIERIKKLQGMIPKFESIGLEAIYHEVASIVHYSQSLIFRLKRKEAKKAIEFEWNRIFVRLDYCCLFVFEILNLLVLAFFLQFAWVKPPEMPEILI